MDYWGLGLRAWGVSPFHKRFVGFGMVEGLLGANIPATELLR